MTSAVNQRMGASQYKDFLFLHLADKDNQFFADSLLGHVALPKV